MYAIVEINGQQFKAEAGKKLFVHHIQYTEFLGNKVVCHTIPIRPGRNLAIIVESAAVNYRQKKMGYNAAQELYNRVQANLKGMSPSK